MKKSTQVAMGGICTSLCLFLMFMASLFPFTQYAFPALAGIVLVIVVIENGVSTAVLVYVAVSLLSLIIVPSKESVLIFISFFGYYPIIKSKLEGIPTRLVEYLAKFSVFNFSMAICYAILIFVLGLDDVLDLSGPLGKFSIIALLILGNITFIIYDYLITNLTYLYYHWFRPRILRKFK